MSKAAVTRTPTTVDASARAKALPKLARYVRTFRETPEHLPTADRSLVRTSGIITGHVMYVRGEGRFQVDLVDEASGEARTVYVPIVIDGPIQPLDRTVAFRNAVKAARWLSRAQRNRKRLIVRRLPARETVRVELRDAAE